MQLNVLLLVSLVASLQAIKLSNILRRAAAIPAALMVTSGVPVAFADMGPAPWDANVQYEQLVSNPKGAMPKVGDLIAVRFIASYNGVPFDDCFKTADPYYFRAGVGYVVKGLDNAVIHMHEGDRVHLKFGGDLAFGPQGRPSAPGRPRIPPNAAIEYDVLLEKVPGTGDDFIADE